ncbi:MAG: hypothetical protein GY862_02300, partial [Gammaproteobacteria bacterium]|nr:hypothetical protein [Gammaproteobacteria bacterium]
MKYALEERIGDPLLFCGRRQQMELLLKWAGMIPRKTAKSRALLGRRKSGKSAIMQRLFNILWNQNGAVIPFYFETQDRDQWLLEFVDAYYRTFASQYLSFKTRTILDQNNRPWKFAVLRDMAKEIKDEKLLKDMDFFQEDLEAERAGQALDWAFSAPGSLAGANNTFALVMIDEIQYMTKHVFWDKAHQVKAYNLPGGYHGLVESKIAPMLVSGSYIGWMVQMMREMFVGGRLKRTGIPSKLTPDEGLEAVYRYADFYQLDITDETAAVINHLTQSDPFYIASLLRSDRGDFSSTEGVIRTLDYEIKNREGELFGTWSEYIFSTIKEVNDQHAKQILLFLSKERHKECTRTEISDHLGGRLSNGELEEKLRILEYGDLITKGVSNFRYSGIPDDILDLIFRELYQEEIEQVKPDISKELHEKAAALKEDKEKKSLRGALNELKGRVPEMTVYRELNRYRNKAKPITDFRRRLRPVANRLHREQMEPMLAACSVSRFQTVWMNYSLSLPQTNTVELDVFARGSDADCCWALV